MSPIRISPFTLSIFVSDSARAVRQARYRWHMRVIAEMAWRMTALVWG